MSEKPSFFPVSHSPHAALVQDVLSPSSPPPPELAAPALLSDGKKNNEKFQEKNGFK